MNYTALPYSALYNYKIQCTVQYCTVQLLNILHCITPHCIIMKYIALANTVLYNYEVPMPLCTIMKPILRHKIGQNLYIGK